MAYHDLVNHESSSDGGILSGFPVLSLMVDHVAACCS